MSTIYLIRHGQASFGAENYDVLSETGIEQGAALGRHFAERGIRLDAIYSGPCTRQLDTARHMIRAAEGSGTELPQPDVLDEFDEYPAIELFKRWLPALAADDAELGAAIASGDRAAAQRALAVISGRWARGELDTGDLETFPAFVDRVESGLERIINTEGRKKQIGIVTSGGPIAVAARVALGLADDTTLKVAWVIANASYSELRYRDDEVTLVALNRIPHIVSDRLLTYR